MERRTRTIAIITTITDDWGGSEELWARAVPYLQAAGNNVTVYKPKINREHPRFRELLKRNVKLQDLDTPVIPLRERIRIRVNNKLKNENTLIPYNIETHLIYRFQCRRPDLVIISQGTNYDGLALGYTCSVMQIPYILIVQKAVDFFWPFPPDRKSMRKVYLDATRCYFISRHNKRLTEEQFGVRFSNADITYNPVKISRRLLPMPSSDTGYRLACIGRYFLLDKGQDILIRVLALPKWQNRPLVVSFIGAGSDKEALMEMAALLDVKQVEFHDQVSDIEQLWQQYHALVLPSRSEGTPLVLLEAMACGRTAIVSLAGGNPELVTDGVTGFAGHANEESFGEAMERAWQARDSWHVIGSNALAFLNQTIPVCPEKTFADSVNLILNP